MKNESIRFGFVIENDRQYFLQFVRLDSIWFEINVKIESLLMIETWGRSMMKSSDTSIERLGQSQVRKRDDAER